MKARMLWVLVMLCGLVAVLSILGLFALPALGISAWYAVGTCLAGLGAAYVFLQLLKQYLEETDP